MRRTVLAAMLGLAWTAAARGESGPTGGCGVATICRPPVQIATRPPRGIEFAPPIHQRPIQIFRREFAPPALCDAPPTPPIHVHPCCPSPVEIISLPRPCVSLMVMEHKPPETACLPELSPLQMFQRFPTPPECAPTLQLPGISIYQRPCQTPPEWGCCIPGRGTPPPPAVKHGGQGGGHGD